MEDPLPTGPVFFLCVCVCPSVHMSVCELICIQPRCEIHSLPRSLCCYRKAMEHRTTNRFPCAFTPQAAEGFDCLTEADRDQCHREAVTGYVSPKGGWVVSAVKHLVSCP